MAGTFQATIGGKFAKLLGLRADDIDIETRITAYKVMTHAASEIFGKEHPRKKPWIIKDVFNLSDERRNLKKRWYKAEGARAYRKANKKLLVSFSVYSFSNFFSHEGG